MNRREQELNSIMDMLVKDFHDAVVAHYKYCLNESGDVEVAKRKCALLIMAVGKIFFSTKVSGVEEELETMGILRKLEEKGIFDSEDDDEEDDEDEEVDVHMIHIGSDKASKILDKIFDEMEREEKKNG